jgi:hypothetical protein
MLVANEILINDYELGGVSNYVTSSILTGSLIRSYVDLSGSNYLSPLEYNYARPYEQFGRSFDFKNITALKCDDNTDYLFAPDITSNTLSKRIYFFKFVKSTNTWDGSGYLTIDALFATGSAAKSLGSVSGYLYRYSSGSVQVNGTGVTGSSTNWETNRIFQGSRIGFGTTSSANVAQWYEIADVPTETNLTLVPALNSYPTLGPGTPYVIEELKLIAPVRYNFTTSFSGLAVINGLHEQSFNNLGTSIYQYSSSADDRKRGCYLIRDASGSIGTGSMDLFATAIHPIQTSPTSHDAYMSSYQSTFPAFQYHKFNINAPVSASTFVSGATNSGFLFSTGRVTGSFAGSANTLTGPVMQIVAPSHGPGSGSYELYHYLQQNGGVAGGRIYRIPINNPSIIYSGSFSHLNDSMAELLPGNISTRAALGIMYMTYVPALDKFIVANAALAGRLAMVKYQNGIYDYWRPGPHTLYTYNRLTSWVSDEHQPKHAITTADTQLNVAAVDDMLYVGAGAGFADQNNTNNTLFAIPIACDWETAPKTKQWVTFPAIDTPNALSYSNVYVKSTRFIGSNALGFIPDQLVIYYRTGVANIAADTDTWKLVPRNGDLSDIDVTDQIQFSVAFDVFGTLGLYNRLQGICFTYNDNQQDDHYLASLKESSISNNQIVWIQVSSWNGNIPTLKINIYNNETNDLLIDDTTTTQNQGTFQYSEDQGSTWAAWDATKNAIGNYIRYTANSLPANINVKIILNKK